MLGSVWLLLPVFGCGLVSFAGFLYVAAQTQRRLYWALAGLYGLVGVAAVTLMDRGARDSTLETVGLVALFGGWFASVVHAIAINPGFLRWQAATQRAPVKRPVRTPSLVAAPPGAEMRGYADPIGVDRESLPMIGPLPWNPKSDRVDVNIADAATLSRLPGLDVGSARRIVDARTAYGSFESLEELAALAPLRPSVLATLRPWVSVDGQ